MARTAKTLGAAAFSALALTLGLIAIAEPCRADSDNWIPLGVPLGDASRKVELHSWDPVMDSTPLRNFLDPDTHVAAADDETPRIRRTERILQFSLAAEQLVTNYDSGGGFGGVY